MSRFGALPLAAVCLLCLLTASTLLAAEPRSDGQLLQAHLDAGEFGPARRFALSTPDPAQRDQLLGRVAAAQAALGARQASLSTAARIGDDRARSQTLSGVSGQPVRGWPARGGGTQADFDSLIDLITSTIAPQTWDEVGGPGAIDGFEGGVYVDTAGLLKKVTMNSGGQSLDALLRSSALVSTNRDVSRPSALRKVSLPRLEKQVQLRWAAGKRPTETMKSLAGLKRVKYVFVYPDSGDIVLAGPAGGWTFDGEGRRVNTDTREPILHLDDLVVVLRNARDQNGRFGCSITPTQQGLADTKQFLAKWKDTPLKPGQREDWLDQLRETLGQQDIDIYGIDAGSRAARVLVEADYRMKLVGMGLEEGTLGVTSYLDAVPADRGGQAPPMDVLRWWFTLNYAAIRATPGRRAFEIRGPGAKVLSENELITEMGKRVHTGKSDDLNLRFARSFTRHFDRLAAKYPIYAELRNVFDLALVAALLRSERCPDQLGWHMPHFADSDKYQLTLGVAPRHVDTVINHRLIDRKHIVAGVSGGVAVDASKFVARDSISSDDYGLLQAERRGAEPKELAPHAWWWD